MGVPDDANPMHRSLPAETVTRRRKVEKPEKKEEPLTTDRGQVLKMKPEHRFKWLSKALQKCQEGNFQTTVLYDIATHAKFPTDASDKVAQKMYRAMRANFSLFSAKQVRYLQSEEFRLAQMFQEALREREKKDKVRAESPASEQSAETGANNKEGVAAVWERISHLSPEAQAQAVGELDASVKERLEEFLVARITRAKEGTAADASSTAQGSGGAAAGGSQSGSTSRGARSRSKRSGGSGKRNDAAGEGKSSKETKGKKAKTSAGSVGRDRSRDRRRGRRGRPSSSSSGCCRSSDSVGSSPSGRSRDRRRG